MCLGGKGGGEDGEDDKVWRARVCVVCGEGRREGKGREEAEEAEEAEAEAEAEA